MYKGGMYVQIMYMYNCMAKEYTLINCMDGPYREYFLPMQGPRMCVCIEDCSGTAKISEGISIIMYFAEIKANEQ